MARPNIVRADTLDLQDTDAPSAAEHHKHPQQTGNAPHLAAQVHQVLEERHSEEQSLADAWNIADTLADRPDPVDQAQAQPGNEQTNGTNGAAHDGEEGADGAEAEADGDDDMMDRISSSPSIDDGGYKRRPPALTALRTKIWPARSTSLSPAASTPTPTRNSFNQIADDTPDSSPFLSTPLHLPLRSRMGGHERSPLGFRQDCNSASLDERTGVQSFSPAAEGGTFLIASKHHHQMGRYDQETGLGLRQEDNSKRILENDEHHAHDQVHERRFANPDPYDRWTHELHVGEEESPRSPISSPFRNHSFSRSLGPFRQHPLEKSPSLDSIDSIDLESVLLPLDDPLLDTPLSPPSPAESTGSWEGMPGDCADCSSLEDDFDDYDDDEHDAFLDLDDRFINSGWGSECLHEAEDIDFEFVYALHTFVATVEGQANATKGDTMVLLDDSNSYWWLVRVVKDSSIGYLPAEHIETPTERLARLNKHRNIDLSATMLSDNSEKSRNPLKKAMRRRNAKTVQFAAPTYVEASDYDYSTEDEEQMIDPHYAAATLADDAVQDEPQTEPEEPKNAEVQHPEAERRSSTGSNRASFDREQAATAAQALAEAGITSDDPAGPKLVDKTEAAPLKSKRTRNTDSFLKDDTIETRKITLTPGLLRDESSSSTKSPTNETVRSNSLDTLTKTSSPTEQPAKKDVKEKKKEDKPKKGGMLSGLFKSKKKDKKTKEDVGEADSEKASSELQRESPRASPLHSGTASPIDKSTISSPTGFRHDFQQLAPENNSVDSSKASTESFIAELEGSTVAHEMAGSEPPEERQVDAEPAQQEKSGITNPLSLAPITNILKPGDKEGKPKKAKRAKQRVELDDFDSPVDEGQNPFRDQEEGDRLSESPVEINPNTFMHGTESIHIPMPDVDDDDDDDDEPESLTSSPSIIEHPAEPLEDDNETVEDNDPTPTAPRSPQAVDVQGQTKRAVPPQRGLSTDSNTTTSSFLSKPSPTVQTWSDDSLKAWLEDGTEVRDMLVMIHDKTGVKPAPPTHPLMSDLFVEQRKGVQDMMGQLDGLLGSYLQRKGVRF